jgi:hypothetical protein
MKKMILAVILVAAVGGVAYYLLQKKKQGNLVTTIDKELVIGKWKIDSLVAQKNSTKEDLALLLFAIDSTSKKQVYDFQPNGQVFISLPNDTLSKKDTSSFTWGKEKELLWKEKPSGATTKSMTVIRLDKKDLVLRSADSTLIYFKKIK